MNKNEEEALAFARKHTILNRDALLEIEPKSKRLARNIEWKGHRFTLLYEDLKTFCEMIKDNRFLFNKIGDR